MTALAAKSIKFMGQYSKQLFTRKKVLFELQNLLGKSYLLNLGIFELFYPFSSVKVNYIYRSRAKKQRFYEFFR